MSNSKPEKNSNNSPRKVFIRTFGCQMNVADSRFISDYLSTIGYQQTENIKEAELVIVNTCTVRQHAEDRALSFIGQLKQLKIKDPATLEPSGCRNEGPKIVVAGCVAERLGEQLKKRYPYIDLIVSAKDVEYFPELFSRLSQFSQFSRFDRLELNQIITKSSNYTVTTFVPITRGCNNYCSYCIVPYVRGEEKYRNLEEIINEIVLLVNRGIKEVTLLGQNVNSYRGFRVAGSEFSEEFDFADLLTEINKISKLHRIRFLTNHPKDMNEKIINAIVALPKVCKHVHLPLQSGSDRILELMNRKYTLKQYISIVNKLRTKIPEVSITTDIMVGFPTETKKDFEDTLNAVKSIQFDFAYVFKYSPREKTKSAELKDDVGQQTKEERHAKLLSISDEIAKEKSQRFINKTVEVLVESMNKDGKLVGKTTCNRTVVLVNSKEGTVREDAGGNSVGNERNEDLISKLINAKIIGVKIHSLIGSIINTVA
ncbi:MAG: tRNA (N6-isopentenyl adenosine(37)-C2)-methylthiotransferase MiaB [Elusimicrobiota bacterium]|nr:tRNA (N6-isopentenyl adenosine(37)-C2)-methylthiotransferase MiaB [Elusimicrobiota bacterium]